VDEQRFRLKSIDQIGFVVPDLDRAMESYWRHFGVGPWQVYEYGPPLVKDTAYRGRPEDYHIRIALAQVNGLAIELIQHLDGSTVHKEFHERVGKGVQHLGLFVDNIDLAIKQLQQDGFKVIQSGRGYGAKGDGAYAYLDTEEELGVLYELIQLPVERVQPDMVYPA